MDRAFVAEWVLALEGGEFPQGREVLRREGPEGDQFCCLGVAVELALRTGRITGEWTKGEGPVFSAAVEGPGGWGVQKEWAVMPEKVARLTGFDPGGDFGPPFDPVFFERGTGRRFTSLASANDAGVGFPEIARMIRQLILGEQGDDENE